MELAIALAVVIGGALWFGVRAARRGAAAMEAATEESRRAMEQPSPDAIRDRVDPRYRAAILLYQTAAMKGDLSDETDAALLSGMESLFSADEDLAADLFSDAWRALGEDNDARLSLSELAAPIVTQCTPDERGAFLALMERIAALEGPPTPAQRALIDATRALLEAAPQPRP